ncbi:MAG TPA: aspartyl protease family protein [Planctomycetaceae bacterium]|nr:aspartyl protease family protein [Planctomycetaceae bacterium]
MLAETLPFVPMSPDVITLETKVGRVEVSAKVENLGDLYAFECGTITEEQVRNIQIDDALVDTGCTLVGLPTRYIKALGLKAQYRRPIRGATGSGETTVYGTVRVSIQGRQCPTDVFEISDDLPVLIGQVPLEQMDFIVNPKTQSITGNPAHGGEHIIECF